MTEKQKPATVYDVAKLAGVGKSTASAVLNGSAAPFAETTRRRIMEAAKDLRYTPNVLARGLNGVRLKSLGISFQSVHQRDILHDYYCLSVLRGILDTAYDSGYNAIHFHRPWHDAKQSAAGFRSQGIDGFLLVAPRAGSDMVSGLSALGIPLVVISTSAEVHSVPSVDVDNESVVRLAVRHLMDLGHRRIAHLYLDGSNTSFDSSTRYKSFLKIMKEAGALVPPEYLQAITGDYLPATFDQARALLSLPEPPTAVFSTNDWLARHAIEAAASSGVRVPEQFSVVGVDDNPNAAASPGITTIRQPLEKMAAEATRMLISLIEGEPVAAETRWFEPELVVRGSTMPPQR